jgi:hypothetical protein
MTKPSKTPATHRRRRFAAALGGLVAIGIASMFWMSQRNKAPLIPKPPIVERCTATARGSSTDLTPDQGGNAALITSMSIKRALPARAATIALATALQESKLQNLNYGDRDSVGLFQQRPSSGWGTKEQIMDPVYATKRFYAALVKVKGWETMPVTKAAQRVQRSAFPSAYADHEEQGRQLASALTGYSPAGFSCVLAPVELAPVGAAETLDAGGLTPRGRAVVTAAERETVGNPVAIAGSGGSQLTITVTGATATRTGWSLAHWAVARAGALEITSVSIAGVKPDSSIGSGGAYRWLRSDTDHGWLTIKASTPTRPSGAVASAPATAGTSMTSTPLAGTSPGGTPSIGAGNVAPGAPGTQAVAGQAVASQPVAGQAVASQAVASQAVASPGAGAIAATPSAGATAAVAPPTSVATSGTATPGAATPGAATPGTVAPGTVAPGTQVIVTIDVARPTVRPSATK